MAVRACLLAALVWWSLAAAANAQPREGIVVRGVEGDYIGVVASDFAARRCRASADPLAYFAFADEIYAIPLSQIAYLAPNAVPEQTTEADAQAGVQRYPANATCREAPLDAYAVTVARAGPQPSRIEITARLLLLNLAETLRQKRESRACPAADGGALVRCPGSMTFGHAPPTPVVFFIATDARLVLTGDVPLYAMCESGPDPLPCSVRDEFGRTTVNVQLPPGEPTLRAIRDAREAALSYMASIRVRGR
jgi:hypothetical protein